MSDIRMPDYSVHGDSDHTIYLLHGAYGAKEYWRLTIKTFNEAGYRVVAWDAPGYGISPVQWDVTIPSMAQALEKLVAATASKHNVLLGQSMGGFVAQKYCDLYPSRMEALILSATAHTFNHSGPEWQKHFMETRIAPIVSGKTIPEYAPGLLKTMMNPGAGGPDVEHLVYTILQMKTEAFQASIKATSQYFEDDAIARIKIPVLCLAGELDETCPPNVLKKMAELAHGEFHEIKGVGHYGFVERPAEYHGTVLDFLKRRWR